MNDQILISNITNVMLPKILKYLKKLKN